MGALNPQNMLLIDNFVHSDLHVSFSMSFPSRSAVITHMRSTMLHSLATL